MQLRVLIVKNYVIRKSKLEKFIQNSQLLEIRASIPRL